MLTSGLGVASTPDTTYSQTQWFFTTCRLRLDTLRLLDVLGLVVIGDLALSSLRRGLANLQH